MAEKGIPTQQDIDKSSVPYRTSDGRTYRRTGANKNSDWIVTDAGGRQTRISAAGASKSIQSAAAAGQLAGVGKPPTEEQTKRQRQVNSDFAASKTATAPRATTGPKKDTTSRVQSKQPVNEKPTLPQASDQKQPQLEGDVNQSSRISTFGQSISQRFDINSFRSELLLNDVLPTHSYLVSFAPFRSNFEFLENTPLTNFVSQKRNMLMLRCENVVLPAPSLLEEENIRRYGYGPVEKMPYGVQFSDVTMTWLVDKNSEIVDFFHQWMNTIVMHDSPNTLMKGSAPRDNYLSEYVPFEVGYKDSYANPIVRIYVYNRQQQTVTEYEMYDVFPMNIQAMNLSWADENQVQKLTVTFAYTNMRVKAPLKTAEQFNFYDQLLDSVSPYEEREQPENKGGKASADRRETTLGDYVKKQINASKPYATDGQYDYYVVELPPEAAQPETPQPIVRNLTSG